MNQDQSLEKSLPLISKGHEDSGEDPLQSYVLDRNDDVHRALLTCINYGVEKHIDNFIDNSLPADRDKTKFSDDDLWEYIGEEYAGDLLPSDKRSTINGDWRVAVKTLYENIPTPKQHFKSVLNFVNSKNGKVSNSVLQAIRQYSCSDKVLYQTVDKARELTYELVRIPFSLLPIRNYDESDYELDKLLLKSLMDARDTSKKVSSIFKDAFHETFSTKVFRIPLLDEIINYHQEIGNKDGVKDVTALCESMSSKPGPEKASKQIKEILLEKMIF